MFFFLGSMYEERVGFVRVVMVVDSVRSPSFMSGSLHSDRKPGGECGYIAHVHHHGSTPFFRALTSSQNKGSVMGYHHLLGNFSLGLEVQPGAWTSS